MNLINWEPVIRAHQDFIEARRNPDTNELGLCMRDGCGSFCAFGEDAWEQAAEHLGFVVPGRERHQGDWGEESAFYASLG